MPPRNYLKAGTKFFFFAANSPESAQDAFDRARLEGKPLSIFNVTPFAGPWDRVNIIGHRSRADILQDLGRTNDDDNRFWLSEELQAVNARYQDAGRAVPITSVAA